MNREELKKTLKPLIKQCIREVLFEESGVLSKVVTEVARGMNVAQVEPHRLAEERVDEYDSKPEAEALQRLKEQKEKMLNAIGSSSYNGVNVFEGTDPLSSAGSPDASSSSSMGPMKNVDPRDPGINLDSIPGVSMDVVRKLMG